MMAYRLNPVAPGSQCLVIPMSCGSEESCGIVTHML